MRAPSLRLLSEEEVEAIHLSSIRILEELGLVIKNDNALKLLEDGGAWIDHEKAVARIPQHLVEEALDSAPSSIRLHSRDGQHDLTLEGDRVTFNPGSTALYVLDLKSGEMRRPTTRDLSEFVKLADALPHIHAQSTALTVSDVPEIIGDWYRLYIVLKNSTKTVITGAFSIEGLHDMKRLLECVVGGEEELARMPMAIFDVCPSAPLMWSEITSQNLIDCAKSYIPAEIIPMPQLGATGPATLAGSLVQHNAEFLSGLVIAQLARRGAPVIYGGSPTTFDMRYATPRIAAVETMMLCCAYAQVGKHYNLPTHAYMGLSDSKVTDAQAGLESGAGIVLGALAGINVVAGPGMLNFESCQSFEKLIIDDEICGMALRLARGIDVDDETLAVDVIGRVGAGGHYLSLKHTDKWFRIEDYLPSDVIDRLSETEWRRRGSENVIQRARKVLERVLREHQPEPLPSDVEKELESIANGIAKRAGVPELPKA